MFIASVPHSGTHTLRALYPAAGFWHFYPPEHNGGKAEDIWNQVGDCVVPIRDPLAVTLTWRSRQTDRTEFEEFAFWDVCIEYCMTHSPMIVKVENLPIREGAFGRSPYREIYARKEIPDLPEIKVLMDWIRLPGNMEWFRRYYDSFYWIN